MLPITVFTDIAYAALTNSKIHRECDHTCRGGRGAVVHLFGPQCYAGHFALLERFEGLDLFLL